MEEGAGGPCLEGIGDNPDGPDVNGDPSLKGVGNVLVLSEEELGGTAA